MKVPRGNDKLQLQKHGCYVDAVRFSKVMSEDEVKSKKFAAEELAFLR